MTHPQLKTSILDLVAKIPPQKIVYFGQIAKYLNSNPRTVGWVLSGLTQEECDAVPWYRVVAKNGYISSLKLGFKGQVQREKLIQEGYTLTDDFVDMDEHKIEIIDL
jgi:alkylated DNA nucleotide flippase Atl1